MVAGQQLRSALRFSGLDPGFTHQEAKAVWRCDWSAAQLDQSSWRSETAELEGQSLPIRVTQTAQGTFFVADQARGFVSLDGKLGQIGYSEDTSEATRLSWLAGPLLILCLARSGVFCFHASAFSVDGQGAVMAFGRSGAGKSTVARALTDKASLPPALAQATSLCDDICPLQFDPISGVGWVLPQFPQLKLKIPYAANHATVALKWICQILPAEAEHAPSIQSIGPAQLHRLLIAHVVASRLFNAADWRRLWQALGTALPALAEHAYVMRARFDPQHPETAMHELLLQLQEHQA